MSLKEVKKTRLLERMAHTSSRTALYVLPKGKLDVWALNLYYTLLSKALKALKLFYNVKLFLEEFMADIK